MLLRTEACLSYQPSFEEKERADHKMLPTSMKGSHRPFIMKMRASTCFLPYCTDTRYAGGGCYMVGIASLLIVVRPLIDPRAYNAEQRAEVRKSI